MARVSKCVGPYRRYQRPFGERSSPPVLAAAIVTTIRAISGLSRQTPSLCVMKSAGSNSSVLAKIQNRAIDHRFHQIESDFRLTVLSLDRCAAFRLATMLKKAAYPVTQIVSL